MQVIRDLEEYGYRFTLDGDQIRYTLPPGREVDPEAVRPLLEELRQRKAEAIAFLRLCQPPEASAGEADVCNGLGAEIREHIRRRGFCLVRSKALGETIAVVDSDHHRRLAPAGYVTYTLAELILLAEGHQAGHITTIGDLRLLHSAKAKLKGVIVR